MLLQKSIQSMTCAEVIWKREVRLLGQLTDFAWAEREALSKLVETFVTSELFVLEESDISINK